MTETRTSSQNFEKITTLTKISETREHALQEIHKQLRAINVFMQRMAENDEKRQQSPNSGSRALTSNANNLDSLAIHSIKNMKLEFPRFHGEDPTCWVYRTN